ncbi:serine O-acetyltransferase [Rhodoplanes sp.]|uniref:serine O-acetyltransferase n=1 Tax=Rhodoplanes sp. TaxID=1968906 RepID=UPI0025FAAA32|nr:serine O-acetyltransferase [Rhodoplanes sp.]
MSFATPLHATTARRPSVHADRLWTRLRDEAETMLRNAPEFGALVMSTILGADGFEDAVARRIAARLANADVSVPVLRDAFRHAFADDPAIGRAVRADVLAVLDRDPATARLIEPVLFFKGFHAIQGHRLAHWAWRRERRDLALWLQSRSSEVFQTDIHPAAPFGQGIFLDHATGLVVGATAVVEDNVSILQAVTLGGTGNETGDRHPKIRHGVLIGAGAKILGNIEIGHCARIAAGSVVLKPVPPATTVAGVPAREVGPAGCAEPARTMDQILGEDAYESFVYVI